MSARDDPHLVPQTVDADGATESSATEDTVALDCAIPAELHARLQAFRPVVETVIEEPISDNEFIALLLDRALPLMLAELIPHEVSVLLESLQGLAARHPAEVYAYVAEVLRSGAESINREALRRRIGFHPA
jgi:hypothetical protein